MTSLTETITSGQKHLTLPDGTILHPYGFYEVKHTEADGSMIGIYKVIAPAGCSLFRHEAYALKSAAKRMRDWEDTIKGTPFYSVEFDNVYSFLARRANRFHSL